MLLYLVPIVAFALVASAVLVVGHAIGHALDAHWIIKRRLRLVAG
jgi:hypothetical protein